MKNKILSLWWRPRWPVDCSVIPMRPTTAFLDHVGAFNRCGTPPGCASRPQKRSIHLPAEVLNQTAAPAVATTSIEGELFDALTVEEQTVLSLFLDGVPVQEVARELKVSLRTIYRRLNDIKLRLSGMNPNQPVNEPS